MQSAMIAHAGTGIGQRSGEVLSRTGEGRIVQPEVGRSPNALVVYELSGRIPAVGFIATTLGQVS
jgi:hypothetical protein